jgi:hypothetical protein
VFSTVNSSVESGAKPAAVKGVGITLESPICDPLVCTHTEETTSIFEYKFRVA